MNNFLSNLTLCTITMIMINAIIYTCMIIMIIAIIYTLEHMYAYEYGPSL